MGEKGKELEALRRHMRELQNIDEDIVRLRAIYWHASTAGSERSNSLLQDYRDQHKDEAALELLETKCSDFHRIIRARREIHELTRADSSKNLILLITALAVPAAVMPTILAHESALSLPLGWYLIITVVVTALLAIAFYWLLRLKEHCALKKEAE